MSAGQYEYCKRFDIRKIIIKRVLTLRPFYDIIGVSMKGDTQMQIVVDITEEDYKIVCDEAHYSVGYDTPIDNAMVAIANGKPLSKGHGRLIDADVVKEKMGNLDGFGFIGRCVDEIPTVLEADKEV